MHRRRCTPQPRCTLPLTMTTRTITAALLLALLSSPLFAQTSASPPAFEAADVQLSTHLAYRVANSGSLNGNRYRFLDATLVGLIASAYNIESDRVVEGPSWLELDHFNIVAKVPPATSPDTLRLMLLNLLADRFGLVAHTDVRPLPALVLTTGSSPPKLKPADSEGTSGCQLNRGSSAPPYFVFSCHNMTVADLALFLRSLNGANSKKTIVDDTGLKGAWNFDIKWNPYSLMGRSHGEPITITDIAEKQLGLKLEAKPAPLPVVVVDAANQKPTPDPPVTIEALPHLPTEFEVAVIKPSKPDARSNGIVPRGTELDARGLNMYQLIIDAWGLDFLKINGMANTPKWFDTDRFDILAKLPAMPDGVAVDNEDLRPMLRSLLEDRFKLKVHIEVRPGQAYVLTALNPNLKRADPSTRSTCHEGPGPDGKDPPLRSLICQNITMAQFVVQVMNFEPVSVGDGSVLDETRLQGGYDFTLSYNLSQASQRPQEPSSEPPSCAQALEPTGVLSFFDAIKQQLGLKLEKLNRPVPTIVIDHIERTPTEN
jgi:uncharacterized protein (TIGR03435 family)